MQQSVQDRTGQATGNTGVSGQRQELYGTVGRIDYNQGWFELRTQSGTATVTLPYGVGDATRDYFGRLRTGATVRIEGTHLGNGRIELYRFI